jgi:hypothetical protein
MKYSALRLLPLALCLLASPLNAATSSATARNWVDHTPRATLARIIGRSLPALNVSSVQLTPSVDGEWSRLSIGDLYGHVAIYDPVRDRMLVFGGADNYGPRTDVWSLSMTDPNPWTKLVPGGTPPASASWGETIYDPVRDRMVVIGRDGAFAPGVWTLSLSDPPQWMQLTPGGVPAGDGAAIYDTVRDRVIVSNGATTWALSLSGSPSWSEVTTGGPMPTERYNAVAIYDSPRDRMVFFGGEDIAGFRRMCGHSRWVEHRHGQSSRRREYRPRGASPRRPSTIQFISVWFSLRELSIPEISTTCGRCHSRELRHG